MKTGNLNSMTMTTRKGEASVNRIDSSPDRKHQSHNEEGLTRERENRQRRERDRSGVRLGVHQLHHK